MLLPAALILLAALALVFPGCKAQQTMEIVPETAAFSHDERTQEPEIIPTLTEKPNVPEETTEPPELTLPPDAEAVTVSTVDEFLLALGPNKKITLSPGTYDLTIASDYGKETPEDAPYTWIQCEDGYQLSIRNLQDLAILGSGQAQTELRTAPRHADVIQFDACQNICLKDMTIGHTEGGEMCSGAVVHLFYCQEAELTRLGLYGCGTMGVRATGTDFLNVRSCEIYECSLTGISAGNSSNIHVFGTSIHNIQKNLDEEYPARAAFSFYNTAAVTVSGCTVENNEVSNLLYSIDSNVSVSDTAFRGNHLMDAAFWLQQGKTIFEGNTYSDNDVRNWYKVGTQKAQNPDGKEISEEVFDPNFSVAAPSAELEQITVSTVDELMNAIGPDREIILDAEVYDLSTAEGYGKTQAEYYCWMEGYDGPELAIQNVDNMTIRSADGDVKAHTISAVPRYANVLTFNQCTNVTLSGFTAGHTREPGSCSGGVLYFENCQHMNIDQCGLFGCGILGVQAYYSKNIVVQNSEIYECSNGGIRMGECENITVNHCTFRDLGGPVFHFNGCRNVTIDGEAYERNKSY